MKRTTALTRSTLPPLMLLYQVVSFAIFVISAYIPISGQAFDSGSDLPKLLPISDDKKIIFAAVGNPFSIRCPVDTKHYTTFIEWSKGRMDLYNKDSDGYTITERGVLKIRNVSRTNAGLYTCNATNGHGSISITFTLIVEDSQKTAGQQIINNSSYNSELHRTNQWEAPKIDKTQPSRFREEVGSSFSITCSASGYPAPHIFWLKKGRKESIQVEGPGIEIKRTRSRTRSQASLILRSVREKDAGIYRCLAKNKIGKDEMDYELNVVGHQYPPEILSLTPPDATIMVGHLVAFRCKGKSLPFLNLHIKWLKTIQRDEIRQSNRTFYLGSSYYKVLDTDEDPIITSSGEFQSELLISNATLSDSGMYVCLVVNDKGYKYKNVSLIVVIPPKMMSSFFVTSENQYCTIFIIFTAAVIMAPIMFFVFLFCKSKTDHKVKLQEVTTTGELQMTADGKRPKKPSTDEGQPSSHVCALKKNQEKSKLIPSRATQVYACSKDISLEPESGTLLNI